MHIVRRELMQLWDTRVDVYESREYVFAVKNFICLFSCFFANENTQIVRYRFQNCIFI